MNKDFSEKKLLSMSLEKQFKILYDLASFIEQNKSDISSNHFEKLTKYHRFLKNVDSEKMQKLHKEFFKVKKIDHQFQIYLLNLERFLGQSKKEYDFIVATGDAKQLETKKFPIVCILDSIRSAHNIGAMFRNAECFGVEELILSGLCPSPETDQVKKTSMGTIENVKWSFTENIQEKISHLKTQGYKVWAIETGKETISLNSIKSLNDKVVLIFGHEQFGISLELLKQCDKIVEIDLYGNKNSLNVSVSQAIALNHLTSVINS